MRLRTVVMAVYREGSLNVELVKRYRQVLARKGIDVKLAPSGGSIVWLSCATRNQGSALLSFRAASRRSKTRQNWSLWARYSINRSGSSHVVLSPMGMCHFETEFQSEQKVAPRVCFLASFSEVLAMRVWRVQ
jgi:hypothetical protein